MPTDAPDSLRALALTCSLKKSPASSRSELIADQIRAQPCSAGVDGEKVRCVDLLRQNAYPPYE